MFKFIMKQVRTNALDISGYGNPWVYSYRYRCLHRWQRSHKRAYDRRDLFSLLQQHFSCSMIRSKRLSKLFTIQHKMPSLPIPVCTNCLTLNLILSQGTMNSHSDIDTISFRKCFTQVTMMHLH